MRESLEDLINHEIVQINPVHKFDVKGKELEFDYSMIDEGIHINDDFLTIIFDGTCHPAGQDDSDVQRDYTKMPLYDPNGKALQVLVSEYSLDSVLKSIIDL